MKSHWANSTRPPHAQASDDPAHQDESLEAIAILHLLGYNDEEVAEGVGDAHTKERGLPPPPVRDQASQGATQHCPHRRKRLIQTNIKETVT